MKIIAKLFLTSIIVQYPSHAQDNSTLCDGENYEQYSDVSEEYRLDTILLNNLYEPIFQQMLIGGLDIYRRDNLTNNLKEIKENVPKIEEEMVKVAKEKSIQYFQTKMKLHSKNSNNDLLEKISNKDLNKIYFLQEPFARCNRNLTLNFKPSDTVTAASERALQKLKKDEKYDTRLNTISRNMEDNNALNIWANIFEKHQNKMSQILIETIKFGIKNAKIKANEMMVEEGYKEIYEIK